MAKKQKAKARGAASSTEALRKWVRAEIKQLSTSISRLEKTLERGKVQTRRPAKRATAKAAATSSPRVRKTTATRSRTRAAAPRKLQSRKSPSASNGAQRKPAGTAAR